MRHRKRERRGEQVRRKVKHLMTEVERENNQPFIMSHSDSTVKTKSDRGRQAGLMNLWVVEMEPT